MMNNVRTPEWAQIEIKFLLCVSVCVVLEVNINDDFYAIIMILVLA